MSQPEQRGYIAAHTSGVLRVRNDTDPKLLANAITNTAQRLQRFCVRAAGPMAVNVTVKACIIANGRQAERGKALLIVPTFDMVQGADHEEMTVLVFNLTVVNIERMAKLYEG